MTQPLSTSSNLDRPRKIERLAGLALSILGFDAWRPGEFFYFPDGGKGENKFVGSLARLGGKK